MDISNGPQSFKQRIDSRGERRAICEGPHPSELYEWSIVIGAYPCHRLVKMPQYRVSQTQKPGRNKQLFHKGNYGKRKNVA